MIDRAAAGAKGNDSEPTVGEFWDQWNGTWRRRDDCDRFMAVQRDFAVSVARHAGLRGSRILDVGCGTGWLGHALAEFGRVWGTDLSAGAIEYGSRHYPELTLILGDFLETVIPGPFDFVVSADAFVHMPDHEAFVRRIADLLKPGGTFLLMTQNPDIWRRRSSIRQAPTCVPHARPEEWPSLGRVRQLLRTSFTVERVTSIFPGGDRGLVWWVENRYVRGGMGRLLGRERWRSLLEWAGLGIELIVVARRT
jgi:2-polyprenyl-3-methyl-5-hydroxy-6-metoxy-1,4-benzoquinol methylase